MAATISSPTGLYWSLNLNGTERNVYPETVMDSSLFKGLQCSICLGLLNRAVTLCEGKHLVCQAPCYETLENRYNQCPVCKTKILPAEPDVTAQRLLDNVKVMCPNSACGETPAFGNLEAHLRKCRHEPRPWPAESHASSGVSAKSSQAAVRDVYSSLPSSSRRRHRAGSRANVFRAFQSNRDPIINAISRSEGRLIMIASVLTQKRVLPGSWLNDHKHEEVTNRAASLFEALLTRLQSCPDDATIILQAIYRAVNAQGRRTVDSIALATGIPGHDYQFALSHVRPFDPLADVPATDRYSSFQRSIPGQILVKRSEEIIQAFSQNESIITVVAHNLYQTGFIPLDVFDKVTIALQPLRDRATLISRVMCIKLQVIPTKFPLLVQTLNKTNVPICQTLAQGMADDAGINLSDRN